MPLPEVLFIQEIGGTLYANRTIDGARGHGRGPKQRIGVYELTKEVRIVSTVEDIPPSEKAASAPQE